MAGGPTPGHFLPDASLAVIARSPTGDEAIQTPRAALDCFAALARTVAAPVIPFQSPLLSAGSRLIFLGMRPPLHSPIVRLSVRPESDGPAAVPVRPNGRGPHTDATFAAVRRLVEQSTLSYGQIRARTGVSHASICRWARDGGWKRPPFAPRSNDLIPAPRASAQLRRRTLAARLDALAERYIRELEESACVDPDKLGEALELLKMAKLAARRRPRRRVGDLAEPEEFRRPIIQLCAAGVDLSRAPHEAVEDFLANRERPAKEDLPPKGSQRSRRAREHAWMMEREG